MVRRWLAPIALLSSPALAAPTIDPVFSDHAVIQRDAPIRLRGTAGPREKLIVKFNGQIRSVSADSAGRWTADLPPMKAGGPYRLEVRGADGSSAAADDLMIGDVWLCSGQSNMEWPLKNALNGEGEVAGANDPQLRLMKVPKTRVVAPQPSLPPEVGWKPTAPDSAKDFSAACYFMARALRQSHGVAVGAIDSTWGGTAIHAWMDDASVRATGGAEDVELLRLYRKDPRDAVRAYGERWSKWWRERSGDRPGAEPWQASDRLTWKPIQKMTFWEQWGDPMLAEFNGAMWMRLRFTLPSEQAAQAATLHLGAIDDFDRTFVNGEAVGQTYMYDKPRNYPLAPGLLKPGTNELVVYILDKGGGGGFWGPADAFKLAFQNGTQKPLGQGWEYSLVPTEIGIPPLVQWDEKPGVTTLYNGMIAPLGAIGLKGVAWYQGEEDVGNPGYDRRLLAMMQGWRRQFGEPALPFLIVGLAGYGQPVTMPAPSNWAALINEQRKAVDADAHAALVSAIDIGDRNDIHPANKQEVGRRLTLAAEVLAYGQKRALTPKLLSASRNGRMTIVHFDQPVTAYGGSSVLGLELCGETQPSCRYASAKADGSTVAIADDGQPATRVRHAWADYPLVNLYGAGRLPVPPFEIAIKP